jgi:predicted nucleic acid-binding protein
VILVDANVLNLRLSPAVPISCARPRWVEGTFAGPEPVRLAWSTILAFLRLTTNPKVFKAPFGIEEAEAVVSSWLDLSAVSAIDPEDRY